MKKIMKRILAMVLTASFLIAAVSVISVKAEEQEDTQVNAEVNKDAPQPSSFSSAGANIDIKGAEEGTRLVFNRNTPGWGRVQSSECYDARGNGIQMEIKDIACANPEYGIAIKFGNDTAWYNTDGYMLVYGNNGEMNIIRTDKTDLKKATRLVSDVREPLSESLSINLRLKGSKYIMKVNGKTYTFTAEYHPEPEAIRFVFGSIGNGNLDNYDWTFDYSESAFSFTVAKISNKWKPGGFEALGEKVTSAAAVSMSGGGKYAEFYQAEEGIQVAFLPDIESWRRVYFTNAMTVQDGEKIKIVLRNFQSEDDNYAMVVRLGNDNTAWYNDKGYMFSYGKSGNFAIIGCDGIIQNPNKADALVSEKREPLGEKLVIEVELKGDQYVMTVNGKSYTVPTSYLSNPKSLYLGFGVWEDGEISTLNFNKSFKKAAVSFVIGKETYLANIDSNKSPLPLADYMAFMEGYEDGTFKPEAPITRGEAILAMANLIIDRDDIEDVYSSDYKDIKKKDKNFDIYAYMERCDFMPDFGDKLEPNKEITRGQFIELLLDPAHNAEGIAISNIAETNDVYGKVCYAIQSGMFALESDGSFDMDATVTRAEAARALCLLIGKTTPISNPKVTFSDVTESTEYKDYIILATNEMKYRTETYKADSVEELQECIKKAIEISKVEDAKVTIELADHVYRVTEPIKIDGSTYGDYEVAITIKNAKKASPVITGNVDLKASEFKQVQGKAYYSYQLPDSIKVDGKYPEFRDFYLNGERLQLARSEEYEFRKSFKDPIYHETTKQLIGFANWIYVDSEIFKDINNDNLSTLELVNNYDFKNQHWRIAELHGIEESSGLMQISAREFDFKRSGDGNWKSYEGWPYWFENHIALLDEPGEFYYDDTNGVVYFYPYSDTDMKNAVLSYPVVDTMFTLNNTSGITFEGITFTGTTWTDPNQNGFSSKLGGTSTLTSENPHASVIYSEYASHFAVRNCTFDELGTNGVFLNCGNHNVVFKGNSFTDMAMSAIVMGRQSRLWSWEEGQSNVIMDNNYVFNIGTDYQTSPGIYVVRVNNMAATHNTIVRTPYSGLSIGWLRVPSTAITMNNVEIAYNYFKENVYSTNDGGSIYVCGANALTTVKDVYNIIHHNYVKSTGFTQTYNGIYLDINSSNWHVYENLVEGYDTGHGPVFNQDHMDGQYTYNNTVENNYTTCRMITTTAEPERNILLINNKHFQTAADLPEEAHKIKEAAGQKKKYASSIVVEDTTVDMEVKEPHITVAREGMSDKDSITFTITNNSDKKASYSIMNTNNITTVTTIPSKDSLELKAGETGQITVAFKGGEKMSKSNLLNLAVVKDNGWKMPFARAIEVDVTAALAVDEGISTGVLVGSIAGIVLLALLSGTTFVVVRKKRRAKAVDNQ